MGTAFPLSEALKYRRSVREYSSEPVDFAVVNRLVNVALAPTSDDGKRSAPSAHAVYPLHLFLAAGRVRGIELGFYRCGRNGDEFIPLHDRDLRGPLRRAAIDDQPWIEECAFILTICGDAIGATKQFADQPPYGHRGSRYMHLEAGAMAQNILLQAVQEGVGSVPVAGFKDEETASVLALEAPLVPIMHLCFGYVR